MKRRGFIPINSPQFFDIVAALVSDEFRLPMPYASVVVANALESIVGRIRNDISVYLETEYVDKVYRDSYYRYYSSKASKYPRDCIRLSFFDNSSGAFTSGTIAACPIADVKNAYLGFLVIRPTVPNIVGRSAIDPRVFKAHDFVSCLVNVHTTVDGIKVDVNAFPSSSQDAESITCAETSLWALMEYYGNKYPEYTPIKPSDVIETLRTNVVDRQLPSNGLSVECLTYAIKKFGFGPRLYHADAFPKLHNILGCYVESGIPMLVALSNRTSVEDGKVDECVDHAVLCIGHETITEKMIDEAVCGKVEGCDGFSGKIDILDYDDIDKKFVFVDDNFPPYQMDYLSSPANRYAISSWKTCEIESIISPLYGKIYMEPYKAKEYVKALIRTRPFAHLCGKKITMRTYLCSTRSYRDYVRRSAMPIDMQKCILDIFMPKFIWVSELSDVSGLKSQEVCDLVLIDATAIQTDYYEPLLVAFANQVCYIRNRNTNVVQALPVVFGRFKSYSNIK